MCAPRAPHPYSLTQINPASIILLPALTSKQECAVPHLIRSISKLFIIILIGTSLVSGGLSQSGRTRPKVAPPRSPANEPPPVINVPAAAAVAKQEQAGTTSRFVLRNGITVIINEHHSAPIAALVARFKASPIDEPWSLSARAKLIDRILLRGTLQRPGNRAVSDLRTLGASI